MILVYVILFAIALFMCKYASKRWRILNQLNKLPSIPCALPLVGNLLHIPYDHKEFPKKMMYYFRHVANDGLLIAWLGTRPFIFIFESEKVKDVLQNSRHLNKTEDYRFLFQWLGTGLLTSSGNKWSNRRRLLEPVFKVQMLEKYVSVMNEESTALIRNLNKLADGESVDLAPQLTLCALDIICGSIMGIRICAQNGGSTDYVKCIERMTDIIQTRQVSLFYRWDWLFKLTALGRENNKCIKKLHAFTRKVISDRKTELLSDVSCDGDAKKRDLSFLDLLIQSPDLTDENVREEVDTFMFAGHDTTGAALQWAVLLLSIDTDVQDNVRGELTDIFGESDRDATLLDLNRMTYLECVIKEVLRMFPPIPLFARELQCDERIGSYQTPAHTTVAVLPPMLHRDPRYFPDPDSFDPERFRNSAGRPSCSYVPFSHGKRNCIGQKFAMLQLKVVLSCMFRRFYVTNPDKTKLSPQDLDGLAEIVYRPAGGVLVKVERKLQTN